MAPVKAILITVRTGSSRLPEKAFLEVDGKPSIQFVIDRAKKSCRAEKIILCTTQLSEDDRLEQLAVSNNIDCFRGSVADKLERWLQACLKFDVGFFVTADGDDLFCEPELIDLAFDQFDKTNADFIEGVENIVGSFTYAISAAALGKACVMKDSDDTEMMWVYFKETNIFKCEELTPIDPLFVRPKIRMTLDYQEDLAFFSNVTRALGGSTADFSLRDIVSYLDVNPDVVKINSARHKDWAINQKQKTKLVLKNKIL
jgi:spore coat polysaccharide biosynthesis protein SpsF (cytidylyltransferase family)